MHTKIKIGLFILFLLHYTVVNNIINDLNYIEILDFNFNTYIFFFPL